MTTAAISETAVPEAAVAAGAVSAVPGSLVRAGDSATAFGRYPQYRDGMRWLEQFITQPHPDLGRQGAVCPRLAPALRADAVWLVAIAVPHFTRGNAVEAGRLLMRVFEDLATGPHRAITALLGFFPGLPAEQAAEFIDDGHRLLRAEFAEQGLMLGEFHASSTVGGVHNRAFPVMRCPTPMFAVRVMTPHDLLFADQPDTPPAGQVAFLRAYQRHVGSRLSPASRNELRARLVRAGQALHSGDSL
ncbi:DUF6875 domain-containing protein [Cryptosporangium minutisporangium]|uniref:DUF6875 domain-containing protein n=1 Tax=Cryptosporangium minutisporangium TaxID=113569 RepID=A0ABP6T2G8_9ACTN